MLYKNEEQFKLEMHPEKVKDIERYFHNKFPVKVVYPPERIAPSKLPHNRLPDKPNSISFDLKATVKTPNGSETWRYAENVISNDKGEKRYMPKKFKFAGTRFLDRNDIELIFFLLRKSPYCQGGDNQGKMVKFMFEDLVSEAEKKVEKKIKEARIGEVLYGEGALPEARLRDVAKAYGIENVDGYSFAQVRIHIEDQIRATADGFDRFFDMINNDDEIKARTSIQKVIDLKLIVYSTTKRAWEWKTKTGMEIVKGGKVAPNKTPMDTLYTLYLGDESFRDDIAAILLNKNPKSVKPKTKEGEEDTEKVDE